MSNEISKRPKFLIAGYGPAALMGINYLLGSGGWGPDNLDLLTYDRPDNQFLMDYARGRGLRVWTLSIKDRNLPDWIETQNFEYLISLHYRDIIPATVLEMFPKRAMNLHGGKLPEYRGCWSPSWAIINGSKESGFAYHYITPGVDEGNLIVSRIVPITSEDTAYSLFHRTLIESMEAFMQAVEMLMRQVEGVPQANLGKSNYYTRKLPFGGYIQPGWSEVQTHRYIRAMYFPPKQGALLKLPDGTQREVLTIEQYKEVKCLKF